MNDRLIEIIFSLGVVSWIIAVLELILLHSFNKTSFKIGLPVIKRKIPISTNSLVYQIGITHKKEEGKFLFTEDNKVYFLSKLFFFEFFRFKTPFPFKMIGEIHSDKSIDITARLPLGPSVMSI